MFANTPKEAQASAVTYSIVEKDERKWNNSL